MSASSAITKQSWYMHVINNHIKSRTHGHTPTQNTANI